MPDSTDAMGPDSPAILDLISAPQPEESKPAPVEEETEDDVTLDDASDTEDDEDTADVDAASEEEPDDDDSSSEDEPTPELDLGPIARWPAEDRELFMSLPRETQETLVARERQREAAFTQKSQKLSEAQKAAEERVGQTTQLMQRLNQQTEAVDNALNQINQLHELGVLPQQPSLDLLDADPIEYHRQLATFQDTARRVQSLLSSKQALEAERKEQMGAQQKQVLAREAQQLVEKVPEFADSDKSRVREFQDGVSRMLVDEFGATADDIRQIQDHRIMHLAAAYYKLKRQVTNGQRVLQSAAKAKPGQQVRQKGRQKDTGKVSARKAETQLRDQMRKSGDVDDVAAFIAGPRRA